MMMFSVGDFQNTYEEIFIFASDVDSGAPGCRTHPRKKKTDRLVRFERVYTHEMVKMTNLYYQNKKGGFIYG